MRLECGKIEACEATPELIRELVRDGAKRGEYMIMMRDDDEESYVQIACDFDEVGGGRMTAVLTSSIARGTKVRCCIAEDVSLQARSKESSWTN